MTPHVSPLLECTPVASSEGAWHSCKHPVSLADPQITLEALLALVLFIPGVAMASKPLQDVTYRGELANR